MLELHSFRRYGGPKLSKPKVLRGVNPASSISWLGRKAKFQIFFVGTDVWIKHRDYFSETMVVAHEDLGAPLSVIIPKYLGTPSHAKGFVYPDAWGSIVLRNEAWLVVRGLLARHDSFPPDLLREILREQEQLHGFPPYDLECTSMARFWESVIAESRSLGPAAGGTVEVNT